jgi:D-alanyl-D-alanine dipeptidase
MEAAKELRKLEALNETLSGDMRMDVIRSFAGDVAASGRLMTAMPGVFQKMQDATSDEADVIFEMTKGSRRNITDMNKAFQLGFGADTFYAFKDNAQLVSQFGDALNPAQIRAMMDAAKKNAITTDEATKTQVDIEKAQRKASNNLQDFLNLGINPVTKAMSILASVIENLTDLIPGAGRARRNAKEAELNRQGKTSARQDQVAAVESGSTLGDLGTAQLSPAEMMSGLRIKSPEAYSGGETSPQLIQAANLIQQKLGGDLLHFSAFNDSYHRGPNSLHSKGKALDFTIADPSKSAEIAAMVKGIPGVSKVIDEYLNPSAHATGKHIHAEISAAAGAILSGPTSGYQPNLTMHGTEAVVPLPDGRSIPVSGSAESTSIMAAQLDKLDELVSVMKSQLSVSNKLLSYSS